MSGKRVLHRWPLKINACQIIIQYSDEFLKLLALCLKVLSVLISVLLCLIESCLLAHQNITSIKFHTEGLLMRLVFSNVRHRTSHCRSDDLAGAGIHSFRFRQRDQSLALHGVGSVSKCYACDSVV